MDEAVAGIGQVYGGGKYNLMLADDDETNRDIVRLFLSGLRGLELTEAAEGRAALSQCLTRRFDIIILDFRLPIIGGDRIARHLRSSSNPNSTTPIIMSTAMSRDEFASAQAHCPHNGFLPKPFTRDDLISVVCKELGLVPE